MNDVTLFVLLFFYSGVKYLINSQLLRNLRCMLLYTKSKTLIHEWIMDKSIKA